jgi:hypothetical protein
MLDPTGTREPASPPGEVIQFPRYTAITLRLNENMDSDYYNEKR